MTMGANVQTFHVLGAFDRFNYGDVLFAHLATHAIRQSRPDARLAFYGTYASDLRSVGGVVTRPVSALFSGAVAENDVVWISGGDVLSTRWHRMAEHSLSPWGAQMLRRVRRRTGTELMNRIIQWMSRAPNRMPWVFDPESFGRARPRVVYVSVGAQGVDRLPPAVAAWERDALNHATWLAVRDRASLSAVNALPVKKVRLMPDSAVLMGDLAEAAPLARANRLQAVLSRIAPGLVPTTPYVCLQCGLQYLSGRADLLADRLETIHARTGLQVIAFAIGRASGHEDHTAAAQLKGKLPGRNWFHVAPNDLGIWDILALIAGSQAYVGTSLHGYITAFSNGIPRVGLSAWVGKLRGFQTDWDIPGTQAGVDFDDLPTTLDGALSVERPVLVAQAEQVAAQARQEMAALWVALG